MDIGQLRVGKGYLMVIVGQQGYLKENLTELHIIVRTTGYNHFHQILPSILAAEMFHQIPQSTHTVTPVYIECVLNVAVC